MAHSSSTIAEQLGPIARRLRQGQAFVRPVSQVLLRLQPRADIDLFNATVDHALRWLNNRAGKRLPPEAWQRKSFELEAVGAQRTAAVSLLEPRFWSARLDDADKQVAQRTWITEVGVGVDDRPGVVFGARLTCATRGEDSSFDRTVPGFVRGIVDAGEALLDDVPMPASPVVVDDVEGVDRLVSLLEDTSRRHPVIVLALPDGGTDPNQTAIDAHVIRMRTLGAAHVCVITGPASFHLSDRVGKEFSVFRRAVRMYRPGFLRWRSNPYDHPLTVPERIGGGDDATVFMGRLVSQALAMTAHAADREDVLPSFETVRRLASQATRDVARRSGRSDAQLLDLADTEIRKLETSLREQKDTYDGLLLDLQQQVDQAEEAKQAVLAEQYALRKRIEHLQSALALATKGLQTPIPSGLDGLEDWSSEHLAGSVTMLSRAFRGVKSSVYEEPRLIYEALLLLRDAFVPMKRDPGAVSKERFEAECQRLRLENAPVGEATRTHPEQYTVRHAGRPRVLDWHFKRGDARERARCFRLYYFWDDDTQCAVVGWLPSHLDNALT